MSLANAASGAVGTGWRGAVVAPMNSLSGGNPSAARPSRPGNDESSSGQGSERPGRREPLAAGGMLNTLEKTNLKEVTAWIDYH